MLIFFKANCQQAFSAFVLKQIRVIGLSPAFHNPVTQIIDENRL